MIDRGRGTGLADEPLARGRVGPQADRQHLYRDALAEDGVLGQIDLAHAALAESVQHAIPAQPQPAPSAGGNFFRLVTGQEPARHHQPENSFRAGAGLQLR